VLNDERTRGISVCLSFTLCYIAIDIYVWLGVF
jgi:hypothetical protein